MKRKKLTRAAALAELHRRGYPVFAGGDAEAGVIARPGAVQAQVPHEPAYPLGPPTVDDDGAVSVPNMLNQPTRINRMIRDMSLQRFLLEWLFTSGGGVTGGAVVYDQPTENDLYLNRDVQRVSPGSEFPIITSEIGVPKVVEVEKWGAKSFITDEARDRNDQSGFTNEIRKMSNTIVRKLNQRAVETIEAIFTDFPGQVIPGNDWSVVTTQGTSPTAYSAQPVGDFVNIQLHNETLELGIEHDTLIMNPQERATLQNIYGGEWQNQLRAYGYTSWFVSNRVAAGTAYSVARGQLGEMRIEKPLGTETWRDKDGREVTWVQSSVRPLMYVRDPFAVVKLTGLAG